MGRTGKTRGVRALVAVGATHASPLRAWAKVQGVAQACRALRRRETGHTHWCAPTKGVPPRGEWQWADALVGRRRGDACVAPTGVEEVCDTIPGNAMQEDSMRFAIYGAGAIGAFLGAKLSAAGEDVTLIARSTLPAMRANGVRVVSAQGEFTAYPAVVADPREAGPVDFVFLTVKAQSLTQIAPQMAPMLGQDTAVVSAQNGIPWWYFQRYSGALAGTHLESVDPGGVIAGAVDPARIIGCIIYPATEMRSPGVIEHLEGDRFSIGELDGTTTERCRNLARALIKAGLKCPIRPDIRRDLWVKLLGNMAFNPLSALTRATMVEIATHPQASAVARAMMAEADAVARALGVEVPVTVDQRMAGAEKVGHHKTSMLLDAEAGKPLELESVVGAVVELGDRLGIPMPQTKTIYGCAKLLDMTLTQGERRA